MDQSLDLMSMNSASKVDLAVVAQTPGSVKDPMGGSDCAHAGDLVVVGQTVGVVGAAAADVAGVVLRSDGLLTRTYGAHDPLSPACDETTVVVVVVRADAGADVGAGADVVMDAGVGDAVEAVVPQETRPKLAYQALKRSRHVDSTNVAVVVVAIATKADLGWRISKDVRGELWSANPLTAVGRLAAVAVAAGC